MKKNSLLLLFSIYTSFLHACLSDENNREICFNQVKNSFEHSAQVNFFNQVTLPLVDNFLSYESKCRFSSLSKTHNFLYHHLLRSREPEAYDLTLEIMGGKIFESEAFPILKTYGSFKNYNLENGITENTISEELFNQSFFDCKEFFNSLKIKGNELEKVAKIGFDIRSSISMMKADSTMYIINDIYIGKSDLKLFPLAALIKFNNCVKKSYAICSFTLHNTKINHLNNAILDLCRTLELKSSQYYKNYCLSFTNNQICQFPRILTHSTCPGFIFNQFSLLTDIHRNKKLRRGKRKIKVDLTNSQFVKPVTDTLHNIPSDRILKFL